MKSEELAKMSNEELLKEEKSLKSVIPFFGGIMIALVIAIIFLIVKNGFTTSSIIPFAIFPLFLSSFNKLKEIKKEIEIRNL